MAVAMWGSGIVWRRSVWGSKWSVMGIYEVLQKEFPILFMRTRPIAITLFSFYKDQQNFFEAGMSSNFSDFQAKMSLNFK